MVCSVSGLCNNEWSNQLQSEYEAVRESETVIGDDSEECNYCNKHKDIVSSKMLDMGSDDLLNILLNVHRV